MHAFPEAYTNVIQGTGGISIRNKDPQDTICKHTNIYIRSYMPSIQKFTALSEVQLDVESDGK